MPHDRLFADDTRRVAGRALVICGAAAIAIATLGPVRDAGIIPAAHLLCVICGQFGGVDALLNLCLFVPLGCGLAVAGVRASRAIPAMCLATLLIETLQLVAIAGRDASIGDVLMNSCGGAIGYLIGVNIDRLVRPRSRGAFGLMVLWLGAWLTFLGVAGYSLPPRPTSSLYFGQIEPSLGGRPPYPGVVLAALLDGRPIPDGPFDHSNQARDALARRDGAEISVVVVPKGYVFDAAPIVHIVDAERREDVLVAAAGADLVFGVRTGASVLLLRPLRVSVHDVFLDDVVGKPVGAPDTVRIRARYSASRIDISATRRGRGWHTVIDLTPGKTWRHFSPFSASADGSAWQSIQDVLFMLLLLFPAGYWASITARRATRTRAIAATVTVALTLSAGFALTPWFSGVAPVATGEILGALAGLIAGAAVAHVAAPVRFL